MMNMNEFNETPIIKKMKNSKSIENLNEETLKIMEATRTEPKATRGRKSKYNTNEERLAARKQQQKEYRERKKQELQELKEKSREKELEQYILWMSLSEEEKQKRLDELKNKVNVQG